MKRDRYSSSVNSLRDITELGRSLGVQLKLEFELTSTDRQDGNFSCLSIYSVHGIPRPNCKAYQGSQITRLLSLDHMDVIVDSIIVISR
jgi:hypothetical protein